MPTRDPDRAITGTVVVDAGIDDVWGAWTTKDGVRSFFAPGCHIEPRVDGLYEIFFLPDAEPGQRGGDGMRILSFEPPKMLSFTWNAPLDMPYVRAQRTSVVVRFTDMGDGRTSVSLAHTGWGEGEEWDRAFEYFTRAWLDVVLERLVYRFSIGPVDWENPPAMTSRRQRD